MFLVKNDKKHPDNSLYRGVNVLGLIGIKRWEYRIRKWTRVFTAIAFGNFFFCSLNDIRAIHGTDTGECHNFGSSQSSLVSDRTAGLGNHLPGMTNVADACGCNVNI